MRQLNWDELLGVAGGIGSLNSEQQPCRKAVKIDSYMRRSLNPSKPIHAGPFKQPHWMTLKPE